MRVAGATVDKLREMHPELARVLTAEVSASKIGPRSSRYRSIQDDSIPVNKRGSGVRRFDPPLASFAQRPNGSAFDTGGGSLIYAIEEPENVLSTRTNQPSGHAGRFARWPYRTNVRSVLTNAHSNALEACLVEDEVRYVTKREDGAMVRSR